MMGPTTDPNKSNVIIPDTGAAKYWYVDPNASGVQSPQQDQQFDPMQYADEQGHNGNDPKSDQINQLASALNRMYAAPEQRQNLFPVNWASNAQRTSAYKTTIMDIGNEQWEVPVPEEFKRETQGPPSKWPQKIMDILEGRARDNLERGYDPFGNPLTH